MDATFIQQLGLALTAVVNIAIAIFVLVKDAKSVINRSFFAFALGAGLWGIGIVLLLWTGHFYLFDKVALYGGIVSVFGLAVFAKVFPKGDLSKRSLRFLGLPFMVLVVLAPFNLFIERGIIHADGRLEPVNGPLIWLYAGVLGVYILYSFLLMLRTYMKSKGLTRLQIQYFFLGAVIFVGTTLAVDIILPATGIFEFNLIGPISSIALFIFTAYAIVRHQLMNIKVVIQLGLIYIVLLSLIVGVYLIVLFTLGFFFQASTNVTMLLSALLTTIAGIFGVPHIERYFRRMTDKIFFKDKYDYSEAVHTLSHILNRTIERENIVKQMTSEFEQILKVSSVSFFFVPGDIPGELAEYFKSNHDVIDCSDPPQTVAVREFAHKHSVAALVPIVLEQDMVALMTLGRKRSGDSFTHEDRKLLKTFCYQAAVALSKAELYAQVKEYSRSLEQKVKERTEKQRQMMVDISHNLQTPLTVVKGELGRLQNKLPDNKKLKTFEHSIDSISQFIFDLLRLAKLEHGSDEELPMHKLSLSELLADLIEYYQVLVTEKNINLTSNIEPNIWVVGNKEKLTDLMTNLMSNAMKFIANERKIIITLKRLDDQVELSVVDTGIGIKPKYLTNIFERFFRIKQEGDETQGSGLGLAIAKRIVERHKGTIEVESETGKGTKFTVRFPLHIN